MPRLLLLLIVTLAAGALLAEALPSRPARADSPELLGHVSLIALSEGKTCAVDNVGVKCWGISDLLPHVNNASCFLCVVTPVSVPDLAGATLLAMGHYASCALASDGSLRCWGHGLGDLANLISLNGDVAGVSIGDHHGCAVTIEGGVKCWGVSQFGELGEGARDGSRTPVDVVGLTTSVVSVAAGQISTCAVTTSGGVKCWGGNVLGELGDGTVVDRAAPTDVQGLASGVTNVSVDDAVCALTAKGAIKCWGANSFGILGDGQVKRATTPEDISGLESGIASVSVGGAHACVVTTSGGVKCWGRNADGELGDGTTTDRSAPVDVFGLQSGVSEVVAGANHTCSLMVSGNVKCWGLNNLGQLGDSTLVNRTVPVNVLAVAPRRPGDVNCDEVVDPRDALDLLFHVAYPDFRLVCAEDGDLTFDSRIDSLDAALILQYSAGLIPNLPV